MAGMASQNVLNLVDTAMVGVLGNTALAAVGVGGFAAFLCQGLVMGVSTGVLAIAARWKGEGRAEGTALILNAALVCVLLFAPPLSLVMFLCAPVLFPYLNVDPAVVAAGVPYLQIRILATVFVGINYAFRGYWNAVDLSKLYMKTLVIMHGVNIVLNYILIFGKLGFPALGVTGAGLATAISTAVGSAIYVWLALRHARPQGFLRELPRLADLGLLIRLSVPSSIQNTLFAAGFTATYWIIGLVGTAELAAANVLMNLLLVAILPTFGLGLAASALVGQALGRADPDDAHQWAWDVLRVAVVMIAFIAVPMLLLPDLILKAFLHDATTRDLARLPMRITGASLLFEAVGIVFMNALQGAGDTKRTMQISVASQWVLFLPLAFLVGPLLGYGLLGIWLTQAFYRTLQAAVFWWFWERRGWVQIKL